MLNITWEYRGDFESISLFLNKLVYTYRGSSAEENNRRALYDQGLGHGLSVGEGAHFDGFDGGFRESLRGFDHRALIEDDHEEPGDVGFWTRRVGLIDWMVDVTQGCTSWQVCHTAHGRPPPSHFATSPPRYHPADPPPRHPTTLPPYCPTIFTTPIRPSAIIATLKITMTTLAISSSRASSTTATVCSGASRSTRPHRLTILLRHRHPALLCPTTPLIPTPSTPPTPCNLARCSTCTPRQARPRWSLQQAPQQSTTTDRRHRPVRAARVLREPR